MNKNQIANITWSSLPILRLSKAHFYPSRILNVREWSLEEARVLGERGFWKGMGF